MTITIRPYMVKVYAMLIKGGSRTIEEIPQEYVEKVVECLETECGITTTTEQTK